MPQDKSTDTKSRKDPARWKWLQEEHGSSLIELALVMPIFFLLIIGAAEFGTLSYDSIEVSNAAYAGALYGAQSRTTAMDTAHMEAAAINEGQNVPGIAATAVTSCACSSGTAITCANSASDCVSPGRIFELVQVNTTATVSPIFHLTSLPLAFTLHGQAILRVQR